MANAQSNQAGLDDRDPAKRASGYVTELLGGNLERAQELMADDIRWNLPPSAPDNGYPTVVTGRTAVHDAFAGARVQMFVGEPEFETVATLADGERAAVMGRLRATTKAGEDYENLYSFHLRFDPDGSVAEMWEFTDTIFAAKKFGIG